ncbi:MAG: hypothetical protein JWL61_2233 [Gemmatimonadetes bacterium]|jgi:hypothetical protein|nr:hypothetical protein [Gemmatimonadota bacterium]
MRTPTKARSVTLKAVLAGLGIALLSACSGSPTGPTASAKVATPAARSNFTGYVVAENDSAGGGRLGMTQIMRRIPVDSLGSQQ